ncbi:MAG TPA: hypothetical protein HA315_02140 [Candidatus Thalassarchaeaceae archaeon]|nr:hypothetical protein [Candidatus Thalassarchaeaceae archaeon]
MEGQEAVSHLNNVLSTDIQSLVRGSRIDGLICDSNGRVADIISCYHMGQGILITGLGQRTQSTRELLTKGVPWDQEISLLDGNGALEHLKIIGGQPSFLLEKIYPELSKLSGNEFLEYADVMFSTGVHNGHQVIDVITRSDNMDFFARVKESEFEILKKEDWDVARIKIGYPGGNEVNTKYLPHDIGMGKLVSLDKGCYPGQEIHARLDSRGRPKKRIVMLRTNTSLELGKYSLSDGNNVRITSTSKAENLYYSLGICSVDVSNGAKLTLEDTDSKITLF